MAVGAATNGRRKRDACAPKAGVSVERDLSVVWLAYVRTCTLILST